MTRSLRVLAVVAGALGLVGALSLWFAVSRPEPIRVGVLHSMTGTMAISELSVIDATLLAIEEINQGGGVLGRRIEAIVVDGRSDWPTFAREAERLIRDEQVATVFGCWTSASRKTVLPVFERYDHLLVYPVQYEGLEQSPNVLYTGAAPNQQITPAVRWALSELKGGAHVAVYIVGSDYVFPRTAGAIIRAQVEALGSEVAAERYLVLGSRDVQDVVDEIVRLRPAVIFNTINGDTNVAFFRALRAAGITPDTIPTVSFSIAEPELQTMGTADMVGDYAVWNYFQSIDSPRNRAFVAGFQQRHGSSRVLSDPMEAAYTGVHLWAAAVNQAGVADPRLIRDALLGRSFAAPGGSVYVDPDTQHLWKTVRVGQIRADGQFLEVWSSGRPVRPLPYPSSRTPAQWAEFLDALYRGWGGRWARPAP